MEFTSVYCLKILSGSCKGDIIPVPPTGITIGPSFESILVLDDSELNGACAELGMGENDQLVIGFANRMFSSEKCNSSGDLLSPGACFSLGDVCFLYADSNDMDIYYSRYTVPDLNFENVIHESSISSCYKRPYGFSYITIFPLLFILYLFYVSNINTLFASTEHSHITDTINGNGVNAYIDGDVYLGTIRKMSDERELDNVVFTYINNTLIIEGYTERGNSDRLHRMISLFRTMHPNVNIRNNSIEKNNVPSINVTSVVGGEAGMIYVDGYGVVYIGDSIDNYVLEHITENEIMFTGPERIVLVW